MALADLSAEQVIELLHLQPHPEGGHYIETYRSRAPSGERGACTHIHFLLAAGERSAWHRVDAAEIWHWHGGAPLALEITGADGKVETHLLGDDLEAGHSLAVVVPPGQWQAAQSRGAWTLVGCTVAPAFEFAGFELAPSGWAPGSSEN